MLLVVCTAKKETMLGVKWLLTRGLKQWKTIKLSDVVRVAYEKWKRFLLQGFDWENFCVLDTCRWSLFGGDHL